MEVPQGELFAFFLKLVFTTVPTARGSAVLALSTVMMEDTQLKGDQLLLCLFRGNCVGNNVIISSLRLFFSTHKPSVCAEVLEFHLMLTYTVWTQ